MSLRGTTCRGNPPKGFRSSTIKSLQHKVSDERYLFMGCFDCTSFRSTRHICTLARYCLFALRSSTTPRSGISSVAGGFHLARQDFICRQANLIARTSLYAPGAGGRGSGAAGVSDKPCRRKWLRTCHLYYVTPKLVCRKSASRRTTVSKLYRWRQFCRSQPARRVKKITDRV